MRYPSVVWSTSCSQVAVEWHPLNERSKSCLSTRASPNCMDFPAWSIASWPWHARNRLFFHCFALRIYLSGADCNYSYSDSRCSTLCKGSRLALDECTRLLRHGKGVMCNRVAHLNSRSMAGGKLTYMILLCLSLDKYPECVSFRESITISSRVGVTRHRVVTWCHSFAPRVAHFGQTRISRKHT